MYFTCARAIGSFWSICVGLNIFWFEWSETLSCVARSEKPVPWIFIGNILLLKTSITFSPPSKNAYKFQRLPFPSLFFI